MGISRLITEKPVILRTGTNRLGKGAIEMPLHPMEWIKSLFTLCGSTICVIVATLLAATSVHAAVLRLNPGDDADNVITFDGAFTATVVQSSAGIDITIPGVTFTLDCEGEPTDSCTVAVSTSSAPAASADDNCGEGFGAYGCDAGQAASTPPPAASTPPPAEETPPPAASTPPPPAAPDPDDDPNTDSTGWGISPVAGSVDSISREAFPASNRTSYFSSPDLGSGGAASGGNTIPVALGLKTVTVLPFTMSSTSVTGGVGYFEPSNAPTGSDLAVWISTSRDGDALQGCAAYGSYDGKLRISTEAGAASCLLQKGGSYYLNVAACVRGNDTDYACRSNAQTGYEAGNVLLNSRW